MQPATVERENILKSLRNADAACQFFYTALQITMRRGIRQRRCAYASGIRGNLLRQYRAIRRRHLWRIFAICRLQKSRFTSSKPSIFAVASCTKFIRICTTSFARYCPSFPPFRNAFLRRGCRGNRFFEHEAVPPA